MNNFLNGEKIVLREFIFEIKFVTFEGFETSESALGFHLIGSNLKLTKFMAKAFCFNYYGGVFGSRTLTTAI